MTAKAGEKNSVEKKKYPKQMEELKVTFGNLRLIKKI